MDHRYGRHGPEAWKRRRQRRLSRRKFLPVLASSVAVVITQDSVDEERIIIIVMPPNNQFSPDFEQGDEEEEQTSFPSQRLLDAPQNEQEAHVQLRKRAEFEADTYFNIVEQTVKDRGGDWPLDDTLRREATNKANVALRRFIYTTLDIDDGRNFYVDVYLKRYLLQYERATGDGTLPNEKTQRLAELARLDARYDREQNHLNDGASEQELNVQAILRAQEVYTFLTGYGTGQVAHILSHVECYKRAYREEIRRPVRPESFPGMGGQSRRYAETYGTARQYPSER